jgi:hypothetical protein
MATATVYIWKGHPRAYKMLGVGHPGLEIKTHEAVKYYITWYPPRTGRAAEGGGEQEYRLRHDPEGRQRRR